MVRLNGNVTITDNGTLNIDGAQQFQLVEQNYGNHVGIIVTNGGLLKTSNTSIERDNYGSDYSHIDVQSGGTFQATNTVFSIDGVNLTGGSSVVPADVTDNTFNTTLILPVQYVSDVTNNRIFNDVVLTGDTVSAGQLLTLTPIGTSSTANQRYVFGSNLTIAAGAGLTFGAGTVVRLNGNVTITDNGTLNIDGAQQFQLVEQNYGNHVGIIVTNGGLLKTSNTSIERDNYGSDYSHIDVQSGGTFQATNTVFSIDGVNLTGGSSVVPADVTDNTFNTTLMLPVQYVSDVTNNRIFNDVVLTGDTVSAGQLLTLTPIGTSSTANQRYVFGSNLTIAAGAGLTFGAGTVVRLNGNVTITDNGTLNIDGAQQFQLVEQNYGNHVGIIVTNGGLLKTSNTSIERDNYGSDYSHIDVQSGGTFQATNTVFSIDGILLVTGSTTKIQFSEVNAPVTVNAGASFRFTLANQESLSVIGSLQVAGSNIVTVSPDSSLSVTGDLTEVSSPAGLTLRGTIALNGSGNSTNPQLLEAMSADLGPDGGFNSNLAMGAMILGSNTYVKLVQSDNSPGSDPKAVYTNSLIVPINSTLDLNGLHLYTRDAQIAGMVINGTIDQLPDSGTLAINSPTAGSISAPGELDNWSFFARAGDSVSVVVDPGSGTPGGPISPALDWAHVTLENTNVGLSTEVSSTVKDGVLTVPGVIIPADGTYHIKINAPADHTSSTGNYIVTAWDARPSTYSLDLNTTVTGTLVNPFSTDEWTFSASAGTQVKFDLLAASATGLNFSLVGPGNVPVFTNLTDSSSLETLPSAGTYSLTAQGTGGADGQLRLQDGPDRRHTAYARNSLPGSARWERAGPAIPGDGGNFRSLGDQPDRSKLPRSE